MKRLTSISAALVAVAALAGCGDNGSGVNLTVTADSSVSDAALATVRALSMSVGGAESYSTTYPLSEMSRTVKLVYRPGVTSGTLSFSVTASDGSGAALAFGHVDGVAVKSGGAVSATLTLSAGSGPGDGGGGDGGTCPGVTQCMGGDGCCPSGCDSTTDSDCGAVCGNGIVEGDEACDDGNTTNGDGCDVTCRHTNAVTTLSGVAGGAGYFDSVQPTVSRFSQLGGITSDGTFAYVYDNSTIRSVRLSTGAATTLAGAPGVSAQADGIGTAARFGFIRDLELIGGALYILDGSTLRKMVLSTKAVTTLTVSGISNPVGIGFDSTQASTLAVVDNFTDLYAVNTGTLVATKLDTSATLPANSGCQDVAGLAGTWYVVCRGGVVKVAAGAVNPVAGTNPPPNSCTQSATALCNGQSIVAVPTQSLLYVVDSGGGATIRVLNPAGTTFGTFAGSTTLGYVDSTTPTSAQFRFFSGARLGASGTTLLLTDEGNFVVRSIAGTGTATLSGAAPGVDAVGATGTDSRYAPSAVRALATDGSSLYAADAASLVGVRKISLANGGSTQIFDTLPGGLTVVGNQLYMGFVDGIRRIPTDGSISTFSSTTPFAGVVGVNAPPKDGAAASAQLSAASMTTDGTNVYFIDSVNRLVRKLDVGGAMVSTLAGTPGTRDVLDGTGAAAHFRSPDHLTCDGPNLYLLDAFFVGDTVVRKIEIATGKVTTVAGAPDQLGGIDGAGADARFAGARGLATDGIALFIGDPGHSFSNAAGAPGPDPSGGTVRQLVLATDVVSTMVGSAGHYTTLDGTGSGGLFSFPGPMIYDKTTKALYLFDSNEGVIRKIK